jgi:hypothetical protein
MWIGDLWLDAKQNVCPTNAGLGGIFTHTPRRHPAGDIGRISPRD